MDDPRPADRIHDEDDDEQLEVVPRNHSSRAYLSDDGSDSEVRSEVRYARRRPSPPEVYVIQLIDDDNHLFILSPAIISLFTSIVTFYPSVIFRKRSTQIIDPYGPLYHYFDEMKAKVEAEGDQFQGLRDWKIFESWVERALSEHYRDLKESLAAGESVSFEDVWALFKPGDFVVIKDNLHQKMILIFTDIDKKRPTRMRETVPPFPYWKVNAWSMVWNPSEKLFQRRCWKLKISRFAGKRLITSLPVYPLHHEEESARTALQTSLTKRGERWRSLVSGTAQCLMHDGAVFKNIALNDQRRYYPRYNERAETINLVGRVIVEERKIPDLAMMSNAVKQGTKDYTVAGIDDRAQFQDWDDIPPGRGLSDDQKLLCPATVSCFDINTQTWYVAAIENLALVKWNRAAMDHLVLAESRKSLLRAVIEQHSKKTVGDIIHNKGIGLVILLHGPSGVGKTLTAESIAESTKMPLIPMSIQSLISDGRKFEANLSQMFADARRWNAILLLDEADIVLEARSFEDINRNGIVSVFLRQLEYYGGVLFLTTNRISTMDEAFQSRIQIAFDYKVLNQSTRRQIWTNLLASKTVEITDDAREAIEEVLDKLSNLDLNGRQIRNTLNMAESLANDEYARPGQLQPEHIERAIDATLKFKKLFNEAKKSAKHNAKTVWAPHGPSLGDSGDIFQRHGSP